MTSALEITSSREAFQKKLRLCGLAIKLFGRFEKLWINAELLQLNRCQCCFDLRFYACFRWMLYWSSLFRVKIKKWMITTSNQEWEMLWWMIGLKWVVRILICKSLSPWMSHDNFFIHYCTYGYSLISALFINWYTWLWHDRDVPLEELVNNQISGLSAT